MGQTPDRRPGESSEEGTVYENRIAGDFPVALGGVRFVNGSFWLLDSAGLFNPRFPSSDEVLLEMDPNSIGMTYVVTRSSDRVTQESWKQTANGRERKRIDYTYRGNNVATEVIKVFSLADGTTIAAQKTITYVFAGGLFQSAAASRDV